MTSGRLLGTLNDSCSNGLRELRGLGKVVVTQKQGLDAAASIRGRRIIRHDNYKEISHSAAMAVSTGQSCFC